MFTGEDSKYIELTVSIPRKDETGKYYAVKVFGHGDAEYFVNNNLDRTENLFQLKNDVLNLLKAFYKEKDGSIPLVKFEVI